MFFVGEVSGMVEPVAAMKVLALLTALTFIPALLLSATCFTRIIIVFGFVRNATGLQQIPPTPVLIGLALFMTGFIMAPVAEQINVTAIQPYANNEIDTFEAIEIGYQPLKKFMIIQTREEDAALFYELSRQPAPERVDQIAAHILFPAYITSELKTAFQMGFLILLPFLIVDVVTAAILNAMNMVMLPPTAVALPIKVLLFVVADGWAMVVSTLTRSFGGIG
jgi:flagellar biosynthetic protein FliP